jgi:hypothetical protein
MATKKRPSTRSAKGRPAVRQVNRLHLFRATVSAERSAKEAVLPEVLDRTVIAIPLLKELAAEEEALERGSTDKRKIYDVIIDLHLEYPGGRESARDRVLALVREILADRGDAWKIAGGTQGINENKSRLSPQYLFGKLESRVIQELVRRDQPAASATRQAGDTPTGPAIYRIWPDFPVNALLTKSIRTVKADAALNSFSATGDGIVWAVMDSGIDATHPHFAEHDNLNLASLPPPPTAIWVRSTTRSGCA